MSQLGICEAHWDNACKIQCTFVKHCANNGHVCLWVLRKP